MLLRMNDMNAVKQGWLNELPASRLWAEAEIVLTENGAQASPVERRASSSNGIPCISRISCQFAFARAQVASQVYDNRNSMQCINNHKYIIYVNNTKTRWTR